MTDCLSLTALEEQVLQVMGEQAASCQKNMACTDIMIAMEGSAKFYIRWEGKTRNGLNYPKINATLGRLRRKKMVERGDYDGSSWSVWYLSPTALEVLGLGPLPKQLF